MTLHKNQILLLITFLFGLIYLGSCQRKTCPPNSTNYQTSKQSGRIGTPFFGKQKLQNKSGTRGTSVARKYKPPKIRSQYKTKPGLMRR